ncbi:MAG TPA: hypothetical protein HPQ04_10335, partial [Rhodospirillaceae bacterium]|nr:hypothetical protein [Rhodospirillaceae bacterium]
MSSQSPLTVHYEVYALRNARWSLHARYGRNEKQQAVDEAKTVERTLGIAAKVVRENYYPSNNVSEEISVYSGDPALRAAAERVSSAPYRGGRAQSRPDDSERAASPAASGRSGGSLLPVRAASSMGLLFKLVLISLASMTVAGIATAMGNMILQKMAGDHMSISEEASSLILFCIFVVSFLASGLPMAMTALNWQSGSGSRAAPKAAAVRRNRPATEKAWPAADLSEDLDGDGSDIDWSGGEDDDLALPPVEDPPEAVKTEEKDAGEMPQPEEQQPEEPPEDEPPDDGKAERSENLKMTMMRFLNGILAEVKKARPNLDSYNVFGIDLLLAGAVDAMGDNHGLAQQEKRAILKNSIEILGTKAATAQTFVDKLEDYMVEPKYLSMVQAGRTA